MNEIILNGLNISMELLIATMSTLFEKTPVGIMLIIMLICCYAKKLVCGR